MLSSFENEIQKGTGLAIIYMKNGLITPSTQVDSILFDNLINNNSYDPQCEGSRHEYIYRILQFYPERQRIYNSLISYFDQMTGDDSSQYQVFGFVVMLVNEGLFNKSKIYERFESYSGESITPFMPGVKEIIEIDGIEGIIYLAEAFGRKIDEINFEWFINYPYFSDCELQVGLSEEQIIELLHGKNNENIERYLSFVSVARSAEIPENRECADEIYAKIKSENPSRLRRWLNKSSAEEIDQICAFFLLEKNLAIKKKIIMGFSKRRMTIDFSILAAEFRRTRDQQYREALINTMILYDNETVVDLVESLKADDAKILWLKVNCHFFRENDFERFRMALADLNPNEIHHIIDKILSSKRLQQSIRAPQILRSAYQLNRCSICRLSIVQKMATVDCLDSNILAELVHDANEDIRQLGMSAQAGK